MIAAAGGTLVGLVIGACVAVWLMRSRSIRCPDPEAHGLTEDDRAQIAAEFEAHTTALHRQVTKYADALAGDDPVLRARLRQFEQGGRP